jgi:glyoxylase-like metal-dependent hydrolase (beta-lactamase superfamily II)
MWRAALACPTRSIGTVEPRPAPHDIFPWNLTAGVWLCGYNDRRSFGAHSWFVPATAGGFMVDAPHWVPDVVSKIEALGGIEHVLLTHRDDIADAARYADHFGADVWIHEDDRDAAPFATRIVTGLEELAISDQIVVYPVPGHTKGSVLYLHDERHLFSGDTLAWFHREDDLGAFRGAAWHSWESLRESLACFARSGHRFEWILPGHGKWHGASAQEMHERLLALVARM